MHPQTVALILLIAVLAVIVELLVITCALRRVQHDLKRLLLRPWCRAAVPPYVEPLEPQRAKSD